MTSRFPIRFTGLNRAMAVLGLSPAKSWVEVSDERLSVRMSWAFRLDAPLTHVRDARPDHDRVWGWGVHGWRRRWLVNGSSSGLVRIDLNPPVRGNMGPIPITVRELRISVEDPDGLLTAVTA
jgi:hypothetical protein